jgi:hypothetical protein
MAEAFKYTATTLRKIEEIIELSGYTLRYEKGNFRSGFCVLDDKNVVVVNKFFDLEGRINSLVDIMAEIQIEPTTLPDSLRSLYDRISLQSTSS